MQDFITMVVQILCLTLVMLGMFCLALACVGWEWAMSDTSGKTMGLAMALVVFWVGGVWKITEGR